MKILMRVSLVGWIALFCAFFPYPLLAGRGIFWGIFLPSFVGLALFLRDGKEKNITPTYLIAALMPWLLAGLFGQMAHWTIQKKSGIRPLWSRHGTHTDPAYETHSSCGPGAPTGRPSQLL
jgi:hypothetical protein